MSPNEPNDLGDDAVPLDLPALDVDEVTAARIRARAHAALAEAAVSPAGAPVRARSPWRRRAELALAVAVAAAQLFYAFDASSLPFR